GSRQIVGTPRCMAPEQIAGEAIDARTDVYALGVLAFFLLTAQMPFTGRNVALLQDAHLPQPPPPASRLAPVPMAVDEVIGRALAKDRRLRPASPAELLSQLGAALGAGPRGLAGEATAIYAELGLSSEDLARLEDSALAAIEGVLPALG